MEQPFSSIYYVESFDFFPDFSQIIVHALCIFLADDVQQFIQFGTDAFHLCRGMRVEEDFRQESSWKKTPCAPVYRTTGRLVRDWCAFYASAGERGLLVPTMRILCLYGKLLARSGDMIDMALDPEDPPSSRPLKIALCKRLLADVNTLMGELFKLHAFSREAERKCQEHEDALTRLHDLLLDVLSSLRTES